MSVILAAKLHFGWQGVETQQNGYKVNKEISVFHKNILAHGFYDCAAFFCFFSIDLVQSIYIFNTNLKILAKKYLSLQT